MTNLFLYHLQRHSDHHANPTRRYQTLRSMDGAPNLPSGYASLIGLTYFPPLWRKLMDHRVLEHYDGDITRVNVQPRLRRQGAGPVTEPRRDHQPTAARAATTSTTKPKVLRGKGFRRAPGGTRFPTTGAARTARYAKRSDFEEVEETK